MDYSTLRRMDADTYMEYVEDCCYKALDSLETDKREADVVADTTYGHSIIHIKKTNKQLIERMLEDKTEASGCFESEHQAKETLLLALIFKSQEIEDWFHSRYSDDESYHRLVLDVDMTDDTGRVISRDYNEHASTGITIVLDRNSTGTAPMGFSVTTAYPSLTYSAPTGRKIMPHVVALSDLGYEHPMDRIYAFARAVNAETFITEDKTVKIRVPLTRSKRIDLYFNEKGREDAYLTELSKPRTKLAKKELEKFKTANLIFQKTKELIAEIKKREAEGKIKHHPKEKEER